MANKNLSDYELTSVQKTIAALNGPNVLMATAFARRFLPAEDLQKFENQKRLEMVLALSSTPEDLKTGFEKIDWESTENVCNMLYFSANPDAIDLAPIQWWDSPQSQVYDTDHGYFSSALYSGRGTESEWLSRYFFNCKAYHSFSSIRITHSFGGEVVGKEMQKTMWECLKKKGLTGSTTIQSSAFCGVPSSRKVLDVCLVYTPGFEYINDLVQSTNWSTPNAREDTLFALGAVDFSDKNEFKLAHSIGEFFKDHIFDFSQKHGEVKIKAQEKIISHAKDCVTLGMSALRTVIGTKLPENFAHIKHQVVEYYAQLPNEQQLQTADWFYNNHNGRNSSQSIRNLKEIMKISSTPTIEQLLHQIVCDQCERSEFIDGHDHQPEMTELANVLKQFSQYKQPVLEQDFLQWVVELGDGESLSNQNMGDVQYLKSWCKYPDALLEIVTSYKADFNKQQLTSWIEASKMRIELVGSVNSNKKSKRKI